MNINSVSIDLWNQINNRVIQQINEGENGKAIEGAKVSLHVAKRLNEPSLIATSLNNIGLLYFKQGNLASELFGPNDTTFDLYLQAMECYTESLRINKHFFGDDSLEASMVISNIGNVYFQIQRYKDAEICFEEALRIKEITLPAEHPSLATTRQNLVLLYQHLGDYDKASKLIDKGLKFTDQESWLPKNF